MSTALRLPPPKQRGQQRGPRRIDGAALDVRGASALCGWSEKKTRSMIERRLMPFRRIGGRIVFLRSELEAWLAALGGCSLEEALENLRARQGRIA